MFARIDSYFCIKDTFILKLLEHVEAFQVNKSFFLPRVDQVTEIPAFCHHFGR